MYGVKSGVTISGVTADGPAASAGLQPEDTITTVNFGYTFGKKPS